MAKALKCDRCGKFFERKDMEEKYYVTTTLYFRDPDSCIDLCPKCYGKLEKWMEENEIDS